MSIVFLPPLWWGVRFYPAWEVHTASSRVSSAPSIVYSTSVSPGDGVSSRGLTIHNCIGLEKLESSTAGAHKAWRKHTPKNWLRSIVCLLTLDRGTTLVMSTSWYDAVFTKQCAMYPWRNPGLPLSQREYPALRYFKSITMYKWIFSRHSRIL